MLINTFHDQIYAALCSLPPILYTGSAVRLHTFPSPLFLLADMMLKKTYKADRVAQYEEGEEEEEKRGESLPLTIHAHECKKHASPPIIESMCIGWL